MEIKQIVITQFDRVTRLFDMGSGIAGTVLTA
jgi:hypothetical protein